MGTLTSFYLIGMAIFVVIYVMTQVARGKEELVSLRNFFLAGMIIFQITGTAASVLTNDTAFFHPTDVDGTSVIFSAMLTVFMVIFFVSYQYSTRHVDKFFQRKPENKAVYSPFGLMMIAAVMIGVGILSQYVLVYTPVLGPGFQRLAYGLYAIAAGLATWAAAPRLLNPFFLFTAAAIILLSMGLTFAQNFGRRDLLGVVLAVLWALYFSHWRYFPFKTIFFRMGVVSIAGLILLALVTSARSGEFRDQSAMQNISTLKDASAGEGIKDVLYGQRAGLNSMWLIESRPDSHPYDTLHSLRLVLSFPIPRSIWVGKPDALGFTMPETEVKVSGKGEGWNIGPGVIGHIANDNPFIALWLYPIILGFSIRFFDRAVIWFSSNPFIVLPMGAAIGQFIALARGELGTFFFLALLNIISAFVLMKIISWALKLIGWIKVEEGSWDDLSWDSDATYDSEYDYDEAYSDY